MRPTARVFFLATALGVGAAVATTAGIAAASKREPPPAPAVQVPPAALSTLSDPDRIARTAEAVLPSVVNISTERTEQVAAFPFSGDPLFERFFGHPGGPTERRQVGSGSGVIVSPEGLVLTNNHVISGADKVRLTLSDGRAFDAKVVGSDVATDLAVLRIDGDVPEGLRSLAFADTGAVRLGQVVLAVGNPFGLDGSVTMGIVSAKGRSGMGINDYEDFIQTDAAINPGNSGGALVDLDGRLVGINSAILSRTGGYQGVGFAIPADMAKRVMESIVRDGKVSRGWLGVSIQDLDSDVANAMEAVVHQGALVADVAEDSPAKEAGLEPGDIVVRIDGNEITSAAELRSAVAVRAPGSKVDIEVERGGKRKAIAVTLGDLARDGSETGAAEGGDAPFGLSLAPLNGRSRERYGISEEIEQGLVVTAVAPGSPAARAGLREGDVVLEVNRRPVRDVAQVRDAMGQAKGRLLLLVGRGGGRLFLVMPVR